MTFAKLGFPFPLFQGPVQDASGFVGQGHCALCGGRSKACFELGIGCDFVVRCGACNVEATLDVHDRADGTCRECGASLAFPDIEEEPLYCFACLRKGRVAITKDTEFGLVTWEHASEGLTHGGPGLSHPDFEMVSTDSDWVRARVDSRLLFELLRTPTYWTIQGEVRMFCCKGPMAFVGAWSREKLSALAPDGVGSNLLATILGEDVPGPWEDELGDDTGIYVFKCADCETLRGNWDLA